MTSSLCSFNEHIKVNSNKRGETMKDWKVEINKKDSNMKSGSVVSTQCKEGDLKQDLMQITEMDKNGELLDWLLEDEDNVRRCAAYVMMSDNINKKLGETTQALIELCFAEAMSKAEEDPLIVLKVVSPLLLWIQLMDIFESGDFIARTQPQN